MSSEVNQVVWRAECVCSESVSGELSLAGDKPLVSCIVMILGQRREGFAGTYSLLLCFYYDSADARPGSHYCTYSLLSLGNHEDIFSNLLDASSTTCILCDVHRSRSRHGDESGWLSDWTSCVLMEEYLAGQATCYRPCYIDQWTNIFIRSLLKGRGCSYCRSCLREATRYGSGSSGCVYKAC